MAAASIWPTAVGAQPGALGVSAGGPYEGGVDEAIFFQAEVDLGGRPPGTEVEVLWDFGDGTSGVGPDVSHSYNRAGTFTVTVTAQVGQDVATDTTTATIQAPTQPGQLTVNAGGPYSGEAGQPVTFEASVGLGGRPPGTEVSVSWEFGDGATGLGQSTTHVYTTPGTYTVRVVASVGPGQTAEATTTATITGQQPDTEPVRLVTGCNNVALTWPVGTPLMSVVNAVAPPGVTESIFTLDAAQGRFRGYSPSAPSFANDFTMVETSLQAVYLCVTASSTLDRPVP
jgi:PKD repeat protein